MNGQMFEPKKNSAWMSMMILLGLTFACAFVVQVVVIVGILISTGDIKSMLEGGGNSLFSENTYVLYTILAASSISTFLLPSVFLQITEKNQYRYFPSEPFQLKNYLVLIFLFLLVSNPAMELVSRWNMDMKLPDFLEKTETWMRSQEDQMKELTERLVMVDGIGMLMMNLLVMAVIPAIVEEYYFRGALQNILGRLFNNVHVAIWVTAIIFSAIHVQFYGFFPRMLLGLIFGYAFVWSKNIWVPIFAHFLNNASVTIIAFVYTRNGKTYEDLQNADPYTIPFYISSIIISVAIAFYFYKISNQKTKSNELKLD
ncbi:CPBP family intramembrane glutamic endopeptidase [Sphingobacterium sp.]|uniref:CPBP family intramembrane glutamic endopeptidase n=1 Tax=Sphingobacterium sp. TaxID=341027 RepID=UPI0028B107DC|nr:CPBP family intramembrane glutamic endopeptidase [Sphingobacterium sp.]